MKLISSCYHSIFHLLCLKFPYLAGLSEVTEWRISFICEPSWRAFHFLEEGIAYTSLSSSHLVQLKVLGIKYQINIKRCWKVVRSQTDDNKVVSSLDFIFASDIQVWSWQSQQPLNAQGQDTKGYNESLLSLVKGLGRGSLAVQNM